MSRESELFEKALDKQDSNRFSSNLITISKQNDMTDFENKRKSLASIEGKKVVTIELKDSDDDED